MSRSYIIIAVAIWGAVGWGLLAFQQHRLACVAFHNAPIVLGLNTFSIYLGATTAGVIGAVAIRTLAAHDLGYLCAGLVLSAIVAVEWATLMMEVSWISEML